MYYLKHLTVAAIAFAIFMGFIAFPVVITNDPRMDIPMAVSVFAVAGDVEVLGDLCII